MGILDKLLEKKDIFAYIEFRIKVLKNEMDIAIQNNLPENKESAKHRFQGRIAELEFLRTTIKNGKLKEKSKMFYNNKSKYLKLISTKKEE